MLWVRISVVLGRLMVFTWWAVRFGCFFFFSSRRRHTRCLSDWSSDVCSSDLEFRAVDLASARAAVSAAVEAGIQHFVYVSVAQPAPVMKAYVAVRGECEEIIRKSGLNATILRPWYVLGPGHRWPYLLVPLYWLFERLPGTRESARRLGLVSIDQMVRALVGAVEHPCQGIRILGVPDIRQA